MPETSTYYLSLIGGSLRNHRRRAFADEAIQRAD